MPEPTVYVQQTNEAGEQEYVPLTEVENSAEYIASLPEDAIQSHPEWQRVDTVRNTILEEQRKFKTRAQAAEAALAQYQTPESEDDVVEPNNNNNKPPSQTMPDEETLYTNFRTRFLEEQNATALALKMENEKISGLVKKHGLAAYDDIVETLRAVPDSHREQLASQLGRNAKQFGVTEAGEAAPEDDMDEFVKRVKGKMY